MNISPFSSKEVLSLLIAGELTLCGLALVISAFTKVSFSSFVVNTCHLYTHPILIGGSGIGTLLVGCALKAKKFNITPSLAQTNLENLILSQEETFIKLMKN